MRILNVQLKVDQRELITMPLGAKLLKVIVKGGIPWLYYTAEEFGGGFEHRVFRIVCAGEEIGTDGSYPADWVYIDSFALSEWFVGHLFEQPGSGGEDKIDKRYEQDFKDIKNEIGEK